VALQALAAQAKVSDHPNNVTLVATFEDQNFVYILFELFHGTCLVPTADSEEGYAKSEQVVKRQAFQLLSAIDYCHKQGKLRLHLELSLSCSHIADTNAFLQGSAIIISVATLSG